MKRIAELVLAPISVGLLLVVLTGPVQRAFAPGERASVITTDTGVRLSATTLREIANDAAPPPKRTVGEADAPSSAVSPKRGVAVAADPASAMSLARPAPRASSRSLPSPTPDPTSNADRLAVYLVDVYNGGSTEIGGKRFNLRLAPNVTEQGEGRFYRVGNAAGTRLFGRKEGLHFRPTRISAWIGVPSLKPGQHYTAWAIGDANRTLLAVSDRDGQQIEFREVGSAALFAPAGNLREALRANLFVLALSFTIALALGVGLWLLAARVRRKGPIAPDTLSDSA